MKYAIYDKAADGYLTKMEFEMGYSDNTQFECGLNEYITEAKLLDTPKEAADTIVRIESFKFMENGRFVVHSFDDGLKDQYIISEAGKPTKVVNSITVDLDGNINVGYGVMSMHWSCSTLEYAINRMNALQKAKSPKYTAWCNTFDIYKVITVTDERSCNHYQFIKVTEKGLTEYAKDEVLVVGKEITDITEPLNKRIEELEKANYELSQTATARGVLANRFQKENYDLKTKVESIKKEARELNKNRCVCDSGEVSKAIANNIIDICEADDEFDVTLKKFSELYKAVNTVYDCNNDSILYAFKSVLEIFTALEGQVRNIIDENVVWKNKAMKAAKDLNDQKRLNKVNSDTIDRMVVEKRAINKELSDAADALKEVNDKNEGLTNMLKEITSYVADIMFATRTTDYDKMTSELIAISNKIGVKTSDDGLIFGISVILNALIRIMKEGNNDIITVKEFKELFSIRNSLAEIIYAMRNAICNNNSDAFCCIENRMKIDPDFNSDPFMAGVRENIKDICTAEKKNIANHDLKNSEIARLANEKERALERAEFYKRMANSVYGMVIPSRCNGKQAFCDVINGKKILVDKKKYDDLIECVNNISLTYEMMKLNPFSIDRPSWLSGIINRINYLTK